MTKNHLIIPRTVLIYATTSATMTSIVETPSKIFFAEERLSDRMLIFGLGESS